MVFIFTKSRFSLDKILCNEFYYGECVIFLNVRISDHVGILPLTGKPMKPKNSSTAEYLLFFNHLAPYDNFIFLTCEDKTDLLEMKKSLLIMRDKPSHDDHQ